jgi:hypothetical protein
MPVSSFYDERYQIGPVTFDRRHGQGEVPNGADIEYFGATVLMSLRTWLKLAPPLPADFLTETDEFASKIADGLTIAPPFFEVDTTETPMVIKSHEGRHRVHALLRLMSEDTEIPVQIFPRGGMRSRHLTTEMMVNLRSQAVAQRGPCDPHEVIEGPLFSEARFNGQTIVYADVPSPKGP